MAVYNITARGMFAMCLKKKRYKTLELAKKYAKILSNKYGVAQYPYYCPLCMAYHLTTHPQR